MIRQREKKVIKMVRRIEDGAPMRVSIVENGANQTPFLSVKSAEGVSVEAEEKDMTTTEKGADKAKASLVRVKFSAAKFADEGSVRKWMDSKGYDMEKSTVAKKGDEFHVTGEDFKESDADKLRSIEAEEGVQYELFEIEDSEGAKDIEDVREDETKSDDSSAVLSEKINEMRVYFSDSTKMKDVMKDADDGMPIGASETLGVFYKALTNAAATGDVEGVKGIATEFGEVFTSLMKMTATLIGESGEKAAVAAEQKSDEGQPANEGNPETAAPAAEEGAKQTDSEGEPAAEVVETDTTLDAVKQMQDALDKVIKTVESAVTDASKKTEESLTAIKSQIDTIGSRVKELESVEQSRKGADDLMAVKQPVEAKKGLSKLEQNLLGF